MRYNLLGETSKHLFHNPYPRVRGTLKCRYKYIMYLLCEVMLLCITNVIRILVIDDAKFYS